MKKLFSLALSVMLVLGAMGTMLIPASAAGSLGEDYPYLFETFETEEAVAGLQKKAGTGTVTFSEGGANGSAGSASIVQTSTSQFDVGYSLSFTPKQGEKLNVSVWVKLNSQMAEGKNNVSLIFMAKGGTAAKDFTVGAGTENEKTYAAGDEYPGTSWREWSVPNIPVGEWFLVAPNVTWNTTTAGGSAEIKGATVYDFQIRLGGVTGINGLLDPSEGEIRYQYDDIRLEPAGLGDGVLVNTGTTNSTVFHQDYDADRYAEDIDAGKGDSSKTFARITKTGEATDTAYVDAPEVAIPLKVGRLYKISGWFRYTNHLKADYVGDTAQIRMYYSRGNAVTADPKNPLTGGYPSVYSNSFPVGEWSKVSFYYYVDDYQMHMDPTFTARIRLCPAKASGGYFADDWVNTKAENPATTYVTGWFDFDNIKAEDLGSTTEAGQDFMDLEQLPVYKNMGTQVYDGLSDGAGIVPGWANTGVTIENVDGALKITNTAKNGGLTRSAKFENGKLYRIRFRAKTDGDTPLPLTLIFDRSGAAGESDIYEGYSNYMFLTGNNKFGTSSYDWMLTDQWQDFESLYTPNYALKEGAVETADLVPKRPNLYFRVIDGADGTNAAAGNVLYFDDFYIEELNTTEEEMKNGASARVENVGVTGDVIPGNTIGVTYDYVPAYEETEAEGGSIVYVYNEALDGTKTYYGVFRSTESFTVPAAAAGKALTIEVIPYSSAGVAGKANGVNKSACSNYVVYDKEAGSVVAAYNGGNTAQIIYTTYYEGQLTSCIPVTATFIGGPYIADVPEDFVVAEGETVKIMLWETLDGLKPICAYAE